MNKAKVAFIFLGGVAIGAAATWFALKENYWIKKEEIDSVKEAFSKRDKERAPKKNDDRESKEAEKDDTVVLKSFKDLAKRYGSQELEEEEREIVEEVIDSRPYVISPEEFGENSDYELITLTYFEDGILTEDDGDELVENVEEIVGFASLNAFGRYEDDCVHVRNDRLKCDYEIIKDPRKFSDVMKEKPHLKEE